MDGRMLFKQMPHNDRPGKKYIYINMQTEKAKNA